MVKRSEVSRLMAVVVAAYPSFEVTETRDALWFEMLGDLDYGLAITAVRRHVMSSRFAPSVAEIREHAAALMAPDGSTAAEAWGELMAAVRRHGYYRESEGMASLSPATRRVAEMIGWRDINLCEEVDVLRGQFLRMYGQVQERTVREAVLPSLLRDGARGLLGDGGPG